MTLTTRLTVYFLAALAVVLTGFSMTVYFLARTYWQHRIDDHLQGCLNVLAAAVEKSDEGGLEWEGKDRLSFPDFDSDTGSLCWIVHDGRGRIVDYSRQGEGLLWREGEVRLLTDVEKQQWATATGGVTIKIKEANGEPLHQEGSMMTVRYPALSFMAALPLQPMQAALRQLAATLAGVSLGLWLLAAFASRWLCRRALMPVRRMADAARAMRAADRDQRLPVAASGDELQELGQAFNDLLTRLQESYERQARFSGDASHQLRTPLTSMLGQIEIALRRPRPAEEYHETLSVLHSQAVRMRQIVESLLFLARADVEAKAPHLEHLDLRVWLREHLTSWAGHVRAADFRTETGDGPVWVQTQAPLLGQLLDNLLDNACKYSAAGTPITMSLSVAKDAVCLTVADAGCGIAEEDISHLFEPFYRSPHSRQQGVAGLGLGLAVAERIALALRGGLHVRSRPGHGSCFTLRLPNPASACAFGT
jgi:heavy metal sensor kinase